MKSIHPKTENKSGEPKKIVVYTAITDLYDNLTDPYCISDECDYVCFTNNSSLKSDVWKICAFDEYNCDKKRKCRRTKILPHILFPEYIYSLWIDANIIPKTDINSLMDKYLENESFASFIHPDRICIYDEAQVCIKMLKDSKLTIENQMERYKKEGYPRNNGLIASGVLLRRHNDPLVVKTMEDWWKEVESFSFRDQLSFNYVAWSNHLKFALIHENIYKNPLFEYKKHLYH